MKQWVINGIRSSGWLLWAPLLASYAPRGLTNMYLNLHIRRYARRLVPFLDPFVTIDIASNSSSRSDNNQPMPSIAFEEAKAYLAKACWRDALEFSAKGTVEGSSFLLSLREGQEVVDHFQGVTVWWLLVPPRRGMPEESCLCLRLMFPQQHRALILDEYLPHVSRQGREDMLVTIDIVNDKSSPTPRYYDTDDGEFRSRGAFAEVQAYLTKVCSRSDVLNLYAEGTVKDDSFLLSLREGEEVSDRFCDVIVWWLSVPIQREDRLRLMFPQQHRALILDKYLPHVRQQGRDIMFGKRSQSLYTNKRGYCSSDKVWRRIDFEHPATFDSLAMNPTKKRRIMEDLDSFRGNKDYYRRIGKPWKRGYLLYGPPGTGKSTMIAAMANHLNYDIYDIELTSVYSNSDLRDLFINMTSKSIIVIEDIDCCFDDFNGQRMKKKGRSIPSGHVIEVKQKVTLSGLLNFIDGVWSAQSGEQIVVLTTNFPDKLDQALIRRGRMDMHIEMSYCCFEAFKTLARNYLDVEAHPLFQRVEELLQVVEIIPADVAECLLKAEVPGSDRGV
ncbi:unnamed protein product [Urochloa decumbens]|uniref:AAA+ ATPase domain-containing protein n=1 Tax=Urochloa decumbens TaxID=240449 RepID=A0ABC9FL49_9POAL